MPVTGKCLVHTRLIAAVREHEVLYNCNLKEYSDNILKMRLWRLIARKCDIGTGEEAKKIWKNLRDGYRCSLKTLKIYENKEPPRILRPWKYVDEMEFVRPYMNDRVFTNPAYYEDEKVKINSDENTMDSLHAQSSTSSFSGGDTDAQEVQEEIECRPDVTLLAQQELLIKEERHSPPTQSANDMATQAMSQLEALASIHQHSKAVLPKRQGRKRKNEIAQLEQPPPQVSQLDAPETVEAMEDSLKLFFDSMYVATKALPAPLQRLIRIKLFQTVTDAEMAAESMHQASSM